MKRTIRNYDGVYRLVHGKKLADSGDLYPGHDSQCVLCRSCQQHSTWAHGALLEGWVSENAIDHHVSTVL